MIYINLIYKNLKEKIFNIKKYSKFSESEQGFTLMELLIVIAIAGILAVMLIPSFNKLKVRIDTINVQRSILTVCRLAHRIAVTKRKDVKLNIDLSNEKLWLTESDGVTEIQNTKIKLPAGYNLDAIKSGGCQTAGVWVVTFFKRSTLDPNITIWIKNPINEYSKVTLINSTGRAKLYDPATACA